MLIYFLIEHWIIKKRFHSVSPQSNLFDKIIRSLQILVSILVLMLYICFQKYLNRRSSGSVYIFAFFSYCYKQDKVWMTGERMFIFTIKNLLSIVLKLPFDINNLTFYLLNFKLNSWVEKLKDNANVTKLRVPLILRMFYKI